MERRAFLRNTAAATVLPAFINGFSIKAFSNSPLLQAMERAADNDHVLVMIQLVGGNDGLNMLIPLDQYAGYVQARSNIAIPQGSVLRLNNNVKAGLHPAMTGLQELYNEEKVCLVQSVGYPSPNFSHFRATDIWTSGSNADVIEYTGWSGRYLDYKYPNYPVNYPSDDMPDPLAIQIGSIVSPAFQGPNTNMGIAISSATDFYNLVAGVQDPVPNTYAGKELSYIRLIASQADHFSTVIKKAALAAPTQSDYPDNDLGAQLKIVARLIAGGLKTRMYMVSIGGFDTHAGQVEGDTTTGQHAVLLKEISTAISAFMADLKKMSVSHRVAGMTFSEFGRRIKSNFSMGTDHGAAAPMIIFGDYVNQGVLGNTPPMPTQASVADNVPMQYDFRSVYASILEQWFCVPATDLKKLLFDDYQSLPLMSGIACGTITGIGQVNDDSQHMITNYPNPFTDKTTVTYKTRGGFTMVQIFDTMGRLISTPVQTTQPAGQYTISFDASRLANGIYYARLQNNANQDVRPMLKVRG